jgi:hypothetical protein
MLIHINGKFTMGVELEIMDTVGDYRYVEQEIMDTR